MRMFSKLAFHARRARCGNQRSGAEQAELGMLPAQQRLDPDHRARRNLILRLIEDRDLVIGERRLDHHTVARRRGTCELVGRGAKLLLDGLVARDQRRNDANRKPAIRIADHRFGQRDMQSPLLRAQRSER